MGLELIAGARKWFLALNAVNGRYARLTQVDVSAIVGLSAATPPNGWLGLGAEEGRGKRRYAPGRCMQPLIWGCPNGTSRVGPITRRIPLREGNSPNGNISVGEGGETIRDLLSRGDPKGDSSNRIWPVRAQRCEVR